MKVSLLTAWLWAAMAACAVAGELPVVGILALGTVDPSATAAVQKSIPALYAVRVVVLENKPLPPAAYFRDRDCYRAVDIVEGPEVALPHGIAKIVALTAHDISATKDEAGTQWRTLGLGQLGGNACVVSTHRLKSSRASEGLYLARLGKLVNHELGHTFGVDHCPVAGCLMQDKRGKIFSVDAESGKPCPACATRLPLSKYAKFVV